MIDTASTPRHSLLVKELEKLSVTKINKLIITHPHGDHIGGAQMLINPSQKDLEDYPYLQKISVAEVYDNGIAHTSKTYKNYLEAIKEKNIPLHSLKAGDTLALDLTDGVEFKVLWPTADFVETIKSKNFDKEDRANNVNNRSIVGRLTYKNFSMMFTGDCEKESEVKIVENYDAADLRSDVLKSGHHGIRTSSTKKFVAAVDPKCVVISAGFDEGDTNYRAPHITVLETYLNQGVDAKNIYCTHFNGTITITSDGVSFSVKPEHEQEDWIDKWKEIRKNQQEQQKS